MESMSNIKLHRIDDYLTDPRRDSLFAKALKGNKFAANALLRFGHMRVADIVFKSYPNALPGSVSKKTKPGDIIESRNGMLHLITEDYDEVFLGFSFKS